MIETDGGFLQTSARIYVGLLSLHERLKAEILILRHQLNILHRKAPKRLRLSGGDRALFVWLYRRFPDIGNAAAIVRPETIIRWHRMGFSRLVALEISQSRRPARD